MKRQISFTRLAIAAFAALAVASYSHAQDAPGVSEKSITIGQMEALTGPLSIYGVPLKAGTVAYVGMTNAKGGINGRQLNLITEDHAFLTPQALAVARKMVSNDHIFALVNPQGNVQTAATFPYLLDQQNVPIFGPYGSLVEWFDPPRKGLFGLQVLYQDIATILGRWVAKDGYKKVVVVHIDGATFTRAAKAAEPSYKKVASEGSIEFIGVKLPTQDYAPIALQILQKKPDVIVTMQTEAEFLTLMRELKNQGAKTPVYGWAPIVTENAATLGGDAVEGVKAVSWTRSPKSDQPAIKEYRDALEKYAPGEKPDFVSLFNFAQMKVFGEALSRIKGPMTHQAFFEALYTLKDYDTGILPPVTFSPERHQGLTSVVPVQIRNGTWENIAGPIDANDPNW